MKFLISIFFLIIVLFFIGCKKKDTQGPDSNTTPSTKTYQVTNAGATISDKTTGVDIAIPKGATTSEFNLSIKEIDTTTTTLEFIGGNSFPLLGGLYKITKDNNKEFNKPITVTIPYSADNTSNSDQLGVGYYSKIVQKWIPVDIYNVDTLNKTVTFKTIHFTIFALDRLFGISNKKNPNTFANITTGFKPSKDGFPFPNNSLYPPYDKLPNGTEGNCAGFSTLSIIYYLSKKKTNIPLSDLVYLGPDFKSLRYKSIYQGIHIVSVEENKFVDIFNYAGSLNLSDIIYREKDHPFKWIKVSDKSCAQKIYDELSNYKFPVLLVLHSDLFKKPFGGHALVVYKYKKGANGTGKFYYYDCNKPGNDNLSFTSNSDGSIEPFPFEGAEWNNQTEPLYAYKIAVSPIIGGGMLFSDAISIIDKYFINSKPSAVSPTVTTKTITNVTSTTATNGGFILYNGGSSITAKGVCWSTSKNPTINDHKTNDGSGDGEYSSKLTNLKPNTTYYVRAYATNDHGTGYGKEVNFRTAPDQGTDENKPENGYASLIIGSWANVEAYNISSDGDTTNHDYFYSSPVKSNYKKEGIATTPTIDGNAIAYIVYYKVVGKILFRSLDPLPDPLAFASLKGGKIWAFSIYKLDSETLILRQFHSNGDLSNQYYLYKRVN